MEQLSWLLFALFIIDSNRLGFYCVFSIVKSSFFLPLLQGYGGIVFLCYNQRKLLDFAIEPYRVKDTARSEIVLKHSISV